MKTARSFFPLVLLITLLSLGSELTAGEMPRLVEKNGRHELLVDGKPYFILGAQMNNSSAWPSMLPDVWPAIADIHANTLEAPVYWQQVEPQQGHFDFANVDTLIIQARVHNVRLVLLWFGSWKNGSMNYAPEWIKLDTAKYPRMVNADGRPMTVLSVFSDATLNADRIAFVALMRHLKEIDGKLHTVIMVQVENETGTWGTARDFSPAAQKAFGEQVPADFVKAMNRRPGTWKEVFGNDADETFSAYYTARYVDRIAAAGKREYPLPMYVNAALRDPEEGNAIPGRNYPSGGPTFNMLNVWKTVAKSIDILAPDIYLKGRRSYMKTLALYCRPDNPLFVPETSNDHANAHYLFSVIGMGGIGFSPFGIDFTGYSNYPLGADDAAKALVPFGREYALIRPMVSEIAQLGFEGKLKTAVEDETVRSEKLNFGKWEVAVSYGLPQFGFGDNPPGNPEHDGCALVAELGRDEFLVTGIDARVSFELSPSHAGENMEYLRVEQGVYVNGKWKVLRLWNGDQTDWGLNFKHEPYVLHVKLGTF